MHSVLLYFCDRVMRRGVALIRVCACTKVYIVPRTGRLTTVKLVCDY